MTAPMVRAASLADIPRMTELLLWGARQREAMGGALWDVAAEAGSVIEAAMHADLEGANAGPRPLWLLAEAAGSVLGVAHAMIVQPPPIYDVGAAPPGLLLDDCAVAEGAPAATGAALLTATETALRAAGAGSMIASCPAGGPLHAIYARHGYAPVTLYLGRHGFRAGGRPAGVRIAQQADALAISRLGARHRQTLAELNPPFWRLHAEADSRWERFLRFMMTLADREVAVAALGESVHGYAVAQPISPLLIPAGHDIARIGVIDDYYDLDFADPAGRAAAGGAAAALLASAEDWFAEHGFAAALVVCPAAWTSKLGVVEQAGYRTAKLWMFKP